MARVLIPLPARDFDPSEAAISWQVLSNAGHAVTFATPGGGPAAADEMMLSGEGLDPWGAIPLLRKVPLIGLLMRANRNARNAYAAMLADHNYARPLRWDAVDASAFDGLLLPGGHRARGMREYLESEALERCIADFFEAQKPVAAICHGVLLAARSISKKTRRSVLYGYRTTALTWALEKSAWKVARVTRFWDPNYYRTYLEKPGEPDGYMSVQQEVMRALAHPEDFLDVPKTDPDYRRKTSGLQRDSLEDARPAFVVADRNYVSARWPGDVHTFAKTFASLLR
ncbi:type 1 glutamine amidotransferase domain-containing protein [Bradyrhizobium sp.]|uniref:type 1 glutamine amidotransferase domain-containing protein n=1 Tax=Bradyrhizobium sp. TaxID=376 RepID=UPI00238B2043|nr:type 1 glutamine amidotransferase domain-containing protein [Bradyrhizobium sp.]MDE1935172.1 DJ-1/PfpI family protein [Bradyrhizobium sp.]